MRAAVLLLASLLFRLVIYFIIQYLLLSLCRIQR